MKLFFKGLVVLVALSLAGTSWAAKPPTCEDVKNAMNVKIAISNGDAIQMFLVEDLYCSKVKRLWLRGGKKWIVTVSGVSLNRSGVGQTREFTGTLVIQWDCVGDYCLWRTVDSKDEIIKFEHSGRFGWQGFGLF